MWATPGAPPARLAKSAQALVGVTLGADGFLYRDQEQDRERHAAAPAMHAIDTLLEGDTWLALLTLQPL